MPSFYHFHADVGSLGAMNCGLLNGHDPSCSTHGMTIANESSCSVVTSHPVGKPHKCYHDLPTPKIRALVKAGVDVWPAKPRRARKTSKRARKTRSR